MKVFGTLLVLLCIGFGLKAQNFTDPVKYNDYIVEQQNKIGEKIIVFNEQMALDNMTYDKILPYYNALLSTTKDALDKLNKLEAFEKNADLKNAATELIKFYEKTFTNEYMEIMKLIFGSDLSETTLNRVNELLQKITNEEGAFDNRFQTAQKAYAKKHNIELEENSLQKELDEE